MTVIEASRETPGDPFMLPRRVIPLAVFGYAFVSTIERADSVTNIIPATALALIALYCLIGMVAAYLSLRPPLTILGAPIDPDACEEIAVLAAAVLLLAGAVYIWGG